MLSWPTVMAFSLAAYILIVVPGPAVMYVIARSLDQGRLAGLMSVLGVAVGALVHTAAAAFGLSALLSASAVAFNIVKYLGAAYLIYLGVKTLKTKVTPDQPIEVEHWTMWQTFQQGIIVNVLNPKAALFFLAFLPQFADPGRGPVWLQICLLGLIFVLIALLSDGMYAMLAGQLSGFLKRNYTFMRGQRYFAGATYIGLGLLAAVTGSRTH